MLQQASKRLGSSSAGWQSHTPHIKGIGRLSAHSDVRTAAAGSCRDSGRLGRVSRSGADLLRERGGTSQQATGGSRAVADHAGHHLAACSEGVKRKLDAQRTSCEERSCTT